MKKYFISLECWNDSISKFIASFVEADLNEVTLLDIAKRTIREYNPNIDVDNVTIKIVAFNNIK